MTSKQRLAATLAVLLATLGWLWWRARAQPETPDPAQAAAAAAAPGAPPSTAVPEAAAASATTPADAPTASDDALDEAAAPTAAAVLAVPAVDLDAPLRIVATPAQLRVWSNTPVHLQAVWPAGPGFDRLVWHFEDGSDPVEGVEVSHTFAESVRDRHVTLEGHRAGAPTTVVSRLLPVERIEVVPVDDVDEAPAEAHLKPPVGDRLLWVGGPAPAAALVAAAERLHATDVVATDPQTARAVAAAEPAGLAVVLWSLVVDDGPPLAVLRDPLSRWQRLRRGDQESAVWASGSVAWVVADTRGETMAEPELKRVHDGLQLAAPYPAAVLLSARPLTQMRDGEVIADRAYRLYEHALRHQASLALSAVSGVFYEGRFGGLRVGSIGSAAPTGCARLLGTDGCQVASLTVLDFDSRGRPEVQFLTGDDWQHLVARAELPREVGKVRR